MVEMSVVILFALLGGAQLMENRRHGKRERPKKYFRKSIRIENQYND